MEMQLAESLHNAGQENAVGICSTLNSKQIGQLSEYPYYWAKVFVLPSSFFILCLITTHDIKLLGKFENLFVFLSRDKILNDIFW